MCGADGTLHEWNDLVSMSEYVVQCARFVPCEASTSCLHVRAVGTGNWPMYTQIWSTAEVCAAMARGDCFFIQSRDGTERARLAYGICSSCGMAETLDTEDPSARWKIRDLPLLP
jgi:hypothetical protein